MTVLAVDERMDCCVHHEYASQEELIGYLPRAWREYIGEVGSLPWGLGGKDIRLESPYRTPVQAAQRPDSPVQLTQRLAESGAGAGVLVHGAGMLFAADNNARLGRELCAASNRWTIERWVDDPDVPFAAGIVVPNQFPEAAAREIHRYAGHERVCMVVMGGNGFGKPFGHPIYDPIYKAAAEARLPVAIHAAGDGLMDSLAHTTAGGLPSFFGESRALAGQSLMTHVTTMIGQGVFDRHPGLRVLLLGGGVAWIPSLLWRLEVNFGAFGREVPWLERSPMETFLEHVRVGSHRLERPPTAGTLGRLLRTVDGIDEVICFASGLPTADTDRLGEVEALLPADWHGRVFGANARALFGSRAPRWPARPAPSSTSTTNRGSDT